MMTLRSVVARGALLGARLATLYGLLFIVIGAIRYGFDLFAAPPEADLWPTWAAGALSLAVAALVITLVMAIAAAVFGALTAAAALGVHELLRRFPRRRAQPDTDTPHARFSAATVASGVAAGVAGAFVILLHLALWAAGLWSWSSLLSPTYLFWLGVPGLLYLAAAWFAGRRGAATRQLAA
jgi:hypothetical protein